MSELEDKISSILSSPGEMEKIMEIARSLSGAGSGQPAGGEPTGGASASPEGPDPKLMALLTRLLGEYNSAGSDKTALIRAMKPYLKPERAQAVDRAAQVAKLARLARMAMEEFSGGDGLV